MGGSPDGLREAPRRRSGLATHALRATLLVGSVALLAACGSARQDRVVTGAAIGGLGGAAISGVTGGSLLRGAVVGGAAGALVGVLGGRGFGDDDDD